ncbi:hypothetical protein P43SY_000141 [Pythium insidiosum]|uniref:Calcineurin-like phosphoesterase domain-containing protein n=1 Tax=Pythium insidiosum TaxID=114742 RepID=A0AAD5LFH3_PYTIN|nr:hypothetical protein P43SY_000141 [Pythium insidiosum]KAJ0403383.1 hypothetical protein ATCC90586_005327 [Pythium insidiosum]
MANGRRAIFIAVIVLAVVGAIVGVVVWQTSEKSSKSNTSSGNTNESRKANNSTTSGPSTRAPSITFDPKEESSDARNETRAPASKTPTSDPSKEKYVIGALAIGDWGSTIGRDSCCKRRADHTPTNVDKNAMDVVATMMGQAATAMNPKPKVVLGHGDSFYWVGIIDKTDQAYRFDKTFESKFSAPSLSGIPWVNVMGNHDYGGSSYICAAGGTYVPCKNKEEIVQGLKNKLSLQSEYKSPNSDRWILKDHFYVHTIEDKESGVSIDVFNVDTNDADVHAAQQICCQCYGYSEGSKTCREITRGHQHCAGGDNEMYDACYDQLMAWGKESREKLREAVKSSKATWKIVNSHYSPYNHYAEGRMKMWWDLLGDLDIQLWMYGHTHGEKHDFAKFNMHFIENGAGGGILNEAASSIPPYAEDKVEKIWSYGFHEYGFFELSASKEWLRARFITYDDKWNVEDDFSKSVVGGLAAKHCWYIPVDGSKGKACAA